MPAGTVRAQSGEGAAGREQLTDRTTFQDQLLGARGHEEGPHQVEGSWMVTVSPVAPPGVVIPPFRVYTTFSLGGAFIGSDRNSPFGSPQHGTWAHTGGDKFAFTFIQDLFDAVGDFQGTLKVRAKLTITAEDDFVGVAGGELRDADGNLVSILCATIRGERITVEAASPTVSGHCAA